MNSRLFTGDLFHARRFAQPLSFSYPLYMFWLDVDELPMIDQASRWFGHNRRRVFSVHDRDYLGTEPGTIREKLARLLDERDVRLPDGRLMMLTCARYFNYVFNPVSFYFGYTKEGALHVAVAEVNNTFNEKHLYVLDDRLRLPAAEGYRYAREKQFHVSPFIDLAGRYDFAFRFPDNGIDLSIDLIKRDLNAFHARLVGQFSPLSSDGIRNLLIRYPLTGFMTMTRIIVQATKLYRRGATVYERPAPASTDTIGRRALSARPPWAARMVLDVLKHIRVGRIEVHLPDGSTHSFGEGRESEPVQWHFSEWRAFRRLLTDGDIGLGETFMNGDWTTNDLTGLIRLFIDNREAVDGVEDGTRWRRLGNRLLSWYRRNHPAGSRRNIAAHYDLSNELFALFLDPGMTYSSAYFEHDEQTLEDAQNAKYRRLCEKVALSDGDHLLEIGCGWGGFACYAARHADCRVTATTISEAQYAYAKARVEEEGLADRVTIILQDYRTLTGRFDKIVSIEMFEAVGYEYYPVFFQTIDRLLQPNGLFAMQTISIPDREFDNYRATYDWIRKYIFPGGLLPSVEVLARMTARHSTLVIQDMENIGTHYAKTLRLWRDQFNERMDAVRALGFDLRFERMWTFYLSYCEAAFDARYLGNLQLVWARPQRNGPFERV